MTQGHPWDTQGTRGRVRATAVDTTMIVDRVQTAAPRGATKTLVLAAIWIRSTVIVVSTVVAWIRMWTRLGPLGVPGMSLGHTNSLAMPGRRPG